MQMRDGYNYEGVPVTTVYHAVRESPQAATTNTWLNFWIRQRKSKRAPNGPV